jgi:hypothetical protein
MPIQQTVTVRKWGWCRGWLGIPYPCRKTVTETRWCYSFTLSRRRCFGFAEKNEACENGIEYHYWTGCFGWFSWVISTVPYQKCFKNRLAEKGDCSIVGDIPPIPTVE